MIRTSPHPSSSWRGVVTSFMASAFLWWCAFEGARSLLTIWDRGIIRNRRGADVRLDDSPFLYWALNGFFGLAIVLCAGLALVCLLIAVRTAFGKAGR